MSNHCGQHRSVLVSKARRSLLAAVMVAMPAGGALAESVNRPLILSGQRAERSGLLDGRADGTFNDFVAPVISASGLVAFEGGVTYSPDDDNPETPEMRAGIWVMDAAAATQRLVMTSGMPAPGTSGSFSSGFSEVRVDALGNVMFDASGLSGAAALAYYHANPQSVLAQVALQTQMMPGGGGLAFGDLRLGTGFINNGHVVINEPVVNGLTPAGTAAVRWHGGALAAIAAPGMAVPGAAAGTVFNSASATVNSSGDNLILTSTQTGSAVTPGYWRSAAGVLSPIVQVGDIMPGFPFFEPRFTALHGGGMNNSGQVAFSGSGADGSFSFSAIYRTDDTGYSRVVARGDAAPQPGGSTPFFSFSTTAINGEGNVAFLALAGTQGLWVARPTAGEDSAIANVATVGQLAIDPSLPANAAFATLTNAFTFNSLDQVAFLAKLNGTGINTTNDDSLWFHDPVDGLKLIARENALFAVSDTDSRIVKTIEFTASGSGGQDGRPSGLSDNGLLAFSLAFTDNTHGIFLHGPPAAGDDFYWRSDAFSDNWHGLAAAESNWMDDLDNVRAAPPGSAGDEKVFIELPPAGGIFIDQQDVEIGSIAGAGARLNLRRRLETGGDSSLGAMVLDRPESELHLGGVLTLNHAGSVWEEGAIGADTAAVLAGARVIVAAGAQLDVRPNAEGLGTRTLAAPLFVQGRVVQHAGTWTVNEAINVEAGGVLDVRNGSLFGAAFVNNAGRLEKTGPGAFEVFVPLNNDGGVIAAEAGTLKLTRGAVHHGGRYELHEGATLSLDLGAAGELAVTGDLFIGGPLTTGTPPTGEMRLLSGGVVAGAGVTATFALHGEGLKLEGGRIGGPGHIRNTGVMRWAGGRIETAGDGGFTNDRRADIAELAGQTVKLVGRFVNEDSVAQGSDFAGHQGGQFILDGADIQNKGQWRLLGGDFVLTGAPSAFENAGGVLAIENDIAFAVAVHNSAGGEVRVDGVTATLAQPGNHAGSGQFVLVPGGAQSVLRLTAPQTFNGAHEIRGVGRFVADTTITVESGELKFDAVVDTFFPSFHDATISGDGTLLIGSPVLMREVDIAGGHVRNQAHDLLFDGTNRITEGGELRNAGTMRLRSRMELDSGGRIVNLASGVLKVAPQGASVSGMYLIRSLDAAGSSRLSNEGGRIEVDGSPEFTWQLQVPVDMVGGTVTTVSGYLSFEKEVNVSSAALFSLPAGGVIFVSSESLPGNVNLAGGTRFEGGGNLEFQFVDVRLAGDVVVELTGADRLFAEAALFDAAGGRLINRSDGRMQNTTIGHLRNEAGVANPAHALRFIASAGAASTFNDDIVNAGRMTIGGGGAVFNASLVLVNEPDADLTVEAEVYAIPFGARATNQGYWRWNAGTTEIDARNLVLDNPGTLDLGPAAALRLEAARMAQFDDELSGVLLIHQLAVTGGTWVFQPGSKLTVTHNNTETLPVGRSAADLTFIGNGRIGNLGADFTNQGALRLLQGTHLSFGGEFENDGLLFIDASSSLTAAGIDNDGMAIVLGSINGDITFTSSSAFSGTGAVNGSVIAGGAVSPGNSPGQLFVAGDYTQLHTSLLTIELAGLAAGTGHDQLVIGGDVTLDGALSILLLDGFGSHIDPDSVFVIVTGDSITGQFTDAPHGARLFTGDGLGSFRIAYSDSSVTLSGFQPVPEPSAAAVMLLASTTLLRRRCWGRRFR